MAGAGYEEAGEAADAGRVGYAGVPAGVPPQYDAVRAKVERGDYSWFDVMSGDANDPDAREVHLWLGSRIDLIRRAWQETESGTGKSVEAVPGQIERESRSRG